MTPVGSSATLRKDLGDSLKDIVVFSAGQQRGTNPCANDNGACAELCLYNGTHPVCACAHGLVGPDGKKCVDYDSFLVYSRVMHIDSVHLTDATNLNAPFPSIQSKEFMRNAIGLAHDYATSTLFYSDINKGLINAVHFNGTGHRTLVEREYRRTAVVCKSSVAILRPYGGQTWREDWLRVCRSEPNSTKYRMRKWGALSHSDVHFTRGGNPLKRRLGNGKQIWKTPDRMATIGRERRKWIIKFSSAVICRFKHTARNEGLEG
ncbi:hypothetical protein AAG570_007274 [Ranatra chinensis]|uniref:LRP2 EGF-like domain-containing protein n=1 Tax=Ranatra chinensis TaxID=642074 RepID=A0ABD0YAK8_9HEMI